MKCLSQEVVFIYVSLFGKYRYAMYLFSTQHEELVGVYASQLARHHCIDLFVEMMEARLNGRWFVYPRLNLLNVISRTQWLQLQYYVMYSKRTSHESEPDFMFSCLICPFLLDNHSSNFQTIIVQKMIRIFQSGSFLDISIIKAINPYYFMFSQMHFIPINRVDVKYKIFHSAMEHLPFSPDDTKGSFEEIIDR